MFFPSLLLLVSVALSRFRSFRSFHWVCWDDTAQQPLRQWRERAFEVSLLSPAYVTAVRPCSGHSLALFFCWAQPPDLVLSSLTHSLSLSSTSHLPPPSASSRLFLGFTSLSAQLGHPDGHSLLYLICDYPPKNFLSSCECWLRTPLLMVYAKGLKLASCSRIVPVLAPISRS